MVYQCNRDNALDRGNEFDHNYQKLSQKNKSNVFFISCRRQLLVILHEIVFHVYIILNCF